MRDFYSGFEGEPEIRLVLRVPGEADTLLRMWVGYFDALMAEIQPEDGQWTGLALPYHLHEGWCAGGLWKVPDLREATAQWERLPLARLPQACHDVFLAVLKLMRDGIDSCGEVWISEE